MAALRRRRCVLNQSSNIPTKFDDDWSIGTEMATAFRNSKWQRPPSWIFTNMHFWRHRYLPNRSPNVSTNFGDGLVQTHTGQNLALFGPETPHSEFEGTKPPIIIWPIIAKFSRNIATEISITSVTSKNLRNHNSRWRHRHFGFRKLLPFLYYLTDRHQNLWKHWDFDLEHTDNLRNA